MTHRNQTLILKTSRRQFSGDNLPSAARAAMEESLDLNYPNGGKAFSDARIGFTTITGIPVSNFSNN